jgi:hypothetical protein
VGAYKSPAKTTRNLKITGLPVEILILIFEHLFEQYRLDRQFPRLFFQPTASAIIFGLACSSFYHALKRLFPVPLRSPWTLGILISNLISDFMGPNYRPVVNVNNPDDDMLPPFLHRSVYGDQRGLQEWRLRERYWDHYDSPDRDLDEPILTDPFNMGEEWYAEAQKIITELEASGWLEGTERLKLTTIYASLKAEEMLTAWSERIGIAGI